MKKGEGPDKNWEEKELENFNGKKICPFFLKPYTRT